MRLRRRVQHPAAWHRKALDSEWVGNRQRAAQCDGNLYSATAAAIASGSMTSRTTNVLLHRNDNVDKDIALASTDRCVSLKQHSASSEMFCLDHGVSFHSPRVDASELNLLKQAVERQPGQF